MHFDFHSVSRRLGLLIGSMLIGLAALTAVFLVSERRLIMEGRSAGVQQNVESAHCLIAAFHRQAAQGRLTDAEARRLALEAVKAMRYGNNEYFFVLDSAPKMVMHPIRPELDGEDLADNKDPSGKRPFIEMVRVVEAAGQGAVPYLWAKPGSEQPVPKVSFVKGFAPRGWIVGSGVYVDTVDTYFRQRAMAFGAAAASAMRSQAERLAGQVGVFRL